MQLTERQAAQRGQALGQYEGLLQQRSELQSQLQQLNRRRNQLDEQRHVATQSARPGIDARLAEIDARTAQLDQQIVSLNDQIAAALARMTAASAGGGAVAGAGQGAPVIRIPQISIPPMDFGRSRRTDMRDVAGFMAAEAVLLGLMGIVFWRLGMKRMRDQFDRMFASQSQQLNQLQNAVDVIGIEVERISEGQRYVTKVISEGAPGSALPVGRKQV